MKRRVIVTGGAHGIGESICRDFIANGDYVCFVDIDQKRGEMLAKEHENLFFYCGDLRRKEELKNFVDFAKMKMGSIDILINNAGQGNHGILSDLDYEGFDQVLALSLKAPYELARLCRDDLILNKGRIINISSARAFQSEPDTEAYASAKGGIVALTHALSASLAPNVLVNCIAPGWIDVSDEQKHSVADKAAIPAGKVGKATDISKAVLFLVNQDFITGETIVIDGGMSKKMIYHGDHGWTYTPTGGEGETQ